MRKQTFKVRLLSLIALCGIVMAFASCSNEDVAQSTVDTNTENNSNLTSFVTGAAATRTSLNYDDGAFFWEAGDCGTADTTGGNGVFNFRLDHQAAILMFQPFTNNTGVKNCQLTKIEVTSDNDITGTYTLDTTTGELTGSASGKSITMTIKDSVSYANGFPLTNSAADLATNGAYVVIRPGTHALTVRYWIKDYITNVEGAITKTYPAFDYEKNDYYDMTANINVTDYDGRQYYQWDAKNNYWNGYEWNSANPWQPVLEGGYNGDYAQITGNFYNNSRIQGKNRYDAINSCKDLPNANEMATYVIKGDPHWDGEEIWTTMGHLHKGGMWFKTKSSINYTYNFTDQRAPNGTDIREHDASFSITPKQGKPVESYFNHYFFVPALGYYNYGYLTGLGTEGSYWTSSAHPDDSNWAYCLTFNSSNVNLSGPDSSNGSYIMKFQ